MQPRYRLLLELRDGQDEAALGQAAIPAHCLEPALEHARFAAMRSGRLPPSLGAPLRTLVEPLWDETQCAPYASGVRLSVFPPEDGAAAPLASCIVPLTFFRDQARTASATLVSAGKLAPGDTFRYRLLAFATDSPPAASAPPALAVEEVARPLPLVDGLLPDFLRAAAPTGEAAPGEMPVFIPRALLCETEALKKAAGDVETGGALLGHLRRDAAIPEIFVEVTAQVPARHAVARSKRLSFTAETWQAIRAAVDLRGRVESVVGWWHSHPARHWCAGCDRSRWLDCPLARDFFSQEDEVLHAAVFPRAWSVAMVLGDRATAAGAWENTVALYGWEAGAIQQRGFHVLGAPAASEPIHSEPPGVPQDGGSTEKERRCPDVPDDSLPRCA